MNSVNHSCNALSSLELMIWSGPVASLGKDIWLPSSHGTTAVQCMFIYLLGRGKLNILIDYKIILKNILLKLCLK